MGACTRAYLMTATALAMRSRCVSSLTRLHNAHAGGSRKGADVAYSRHVPKFLQGHMHLLGRKEAGPDGEEAMAVEAPEEVQDDDLDAQDEQEALQRAVRENPALAVQYPELAKVVDQGRAAEEKEKGNRAFADQKYEEAVSHFSECIRLDPGNEVYYSNRAAAFTSLKKYDEALRDSKEVVRLKPAWARGWARLGAAYFGLKLYLEAVEAYEKAVGMEPKNESLQHALQKASVQAHKQEAEGKHTFKAKSVRGKLNGSLGGVKKVRSEDRAPNRSNGPLSFDPDNDE
eukprot:jgi/Botrbrau1/6749/Bobra.0324s0034.1